jgi:hypothetical protein
VEQAADEVDQLERSKGDQSQGEAAQGGRLGTTRGGKRGDRGVGSGEGAMASDDGLPKGR